MKCAGVELKMQLVEISGNKKSIWEFKMDMMGEISLTRLRGKGGEVELCSTAIHYSY